MATGKATAAVKLPLKAEVVFWRMRKAIDTEIGTVMIDFLTFYAKYL